MIMGIVKGWGKENTGTGNAGLLLSENRYAVEEKFRRDAIYRALLLSSYHVLSLLTLDVK